MILYQFMNDLLLNVFLVKLPISS